MEELQPVTYRLMVNWVKFELQVEPIYISLV